MPFEKYRLAVQGGALAAKYYKNLGEQLAATADELLRRFNQIKPDVEKARASRRGAERGGTRSGRERRRAALKANAPLYQAWELYHRAQPGRSPEAFARELASDRAPIFNQFAPPGDLAERIRALGAMIRRYEKKK